MISKLKKLIFREAVRYLIVGGVSFLIDYVIFISLNYGFNLSVKASSVISFFTAFCVSFLLQKQWTFNNKEHVRNTTSQVFYNILLASFNLIIAAILTDNLVRIGIDAFLARPLIFGMIMVWNYFIYKKVIFK